MERRAAVHDLTSDLVLCTITFHTFNFNFYSRHVCLMKNIVFLLLCLLYSTSAHAQCRIGSGPDFGDGIPYCSQVAPPSRPLQVVDHAAAVATGKTEAKSCLLALRTMMKRQPQSRPIGKCQKLGWANCKIIASVTNGVIAIARDAERGLRSRRDETFRHAKAGIREACKRANTKCKIEATFDGREET